MLGELLDLFGDADPVIRTGAVLGLDAVRDQWDADGLIAAAQRHAAALAVAPVGFAGAVHAELAHEVLRRAAEVVRPRQRRALARIVDALSVPALRPWLVAGLAGSVADLVVANAAQWGRTGETGPLFRLGAHRDRCAFAAALAPWPPDAIIRVGQGPWTDTERAELQAAMGAPPAV
jgi:hypothetical protein